MRKIHIGLSAAVAAVVVAGLCPTAAQAADRSEASTAVVAPTTFGRAAVSVTSPQGRAAAAEDARVRAYWTPQRLASAVPYQSTRAGKAAVRTKPVANGPAGSTAPAAPLIRTAATGKAGGAVGPLAPPVTYWSNTN